MQLEIWWNEDSERMMGSPLSQLLFEGQRSFNLVFNLFEDELQEW